MSDSSSPVKFLKPCGKRGPSPATPTNDHRQKLPKFISCATEMPPLSPVPSTPSPLRYPVEEFNRTLSQSTTWRTEAAPAKPMTRHERLLKLHEDGYPHANPFAKALAQMYVASGLAECCPLSVFPDRRPVSAATAAHASAVAALAAVVAAAKSAAASTAPIAVAAPL